MKEKSERPFSGKKIEAENGAIFEKSDYRKRNRCDRFDKTNRRHNEI